MQNPKKSGITHTDLKITLSALLSIVDQEAQILIIHHMGANCYEAVATGPVREAQVAHCVEACGDQLVERVTVDGEGYPWDVTPHLIITIGKEEAT